MWYDILRKEGGNTRAHIYVIIWPGLLSPAGFAPSAYAGVVRPRHHE